MPVFALVACFDSAPPVDAAIACIDDDDCPAGLACRPGQLRCVAPPLAVPACGDGIIDPGEACDDGDDNATVADACRPDCVRPTCGDGIFPGFLSRPTHVTVSPTGNVFIADTGNHRVLKVGPAGGLIEVIGDGTPSSAGDGGPARRFPVDSPGQLAVDGHGNLTSPRGPRCA